MSSLTRPRGPLPPRVYWARRLSVLGMALLLVFGIGRVLGSSSDGSSGPAVAQQAGAQPSATDSPSAGARAERKREKKLRRARSVTPSPTAPALAPPRGACESSDIVVTPEITREEGGSPMLIVLELTTRIAEACTWTVSPGTLTLKITSGSDDIWSSRQCPTAVPTRAIVVRQAMGTKVGVRWNGKRSDDACSMLTEWAVPGYYHVVAAALAGEPTDVQFKLVKPAARVVTKTVTPSPSPADKPKKGKRGRG